MIKILHTIDTTGPGGAETVFVNLIKGLDRQKYEPVVVIRGPGWVYDELIKMGISPYIIDCKGSFNLRYLLDLIRIIEKNKISIIQSHLLGSNLYCSIAGIICRIPVVSTFHGFIDIDDKERFVEAKCRIINIGSSRLVFVSNNLRNFYVSQKGFSSTKSYTIYNGVDTSRFKRQREGCIRSMLELTEDSILVGTVGNIRMSKGYEYLLKAAKLVIDEQPEFRFVVAGEGEGALKDELMELRKELGLEKYLYFIGFESNIPMFLNSIDIFVLPSISEGFSISTIEAMACGLPVVATKSGGPEEIINHLIDGILIKPKSPEQISSALLKLFIDKKLRDSLKLQSVISVENKFSIGSILRSYEIMYEDLIYK